MPVIVESRTFLPIRIMAELMGYEVDWKEATQEINQSYTYDKLNRLTGVLENGIVVATYAYDNKGNRTQTVANGITTTYAYNLANVLTGRTDNKLCESYTYYLNGNQKTKTSNNTTTVYEYDSMNRLVRENDTEYSFDDFGNRATMENDDVTVTYEYDKNNRLIRSAEVTGNITKTTKYFFDYNGNQITKAVTTNIPYEDLNNADYTISQATDENIAIYEYDCYNRLVSIDTNGAKSVYTYAPDGLRESKTVSGVTTNLVYDNANVVEEIAGNSVNKYIRGLEIIKNGGNVYYLYNGQGDVALLVDNAGTTLANYAFDAYGNQSEENTVYNPFGYRGEYTDGDSGFIYLRARMYDPEIGRFINEDPVNDGLNWYVYCDNNPILFIDPTGNESYVFYTSGKKSDFSEQANWQKSYLERGGETVIMKTINSVDEFTKAWDSIGFDLNGNSVSVNKVIIYSHSNDRTLILLDGSSTKALSIDGKNSAGKAIGDLSKLTYKNINELQLLSCNAGHLDPYFAGNSNVASVMSKRISGVTYAYDGNVAFGNPSWKLWGEDIGLSSRLSTTQNSFNQITAYYGKSGRKPKGKLTYYNGEYKAYGYWYGTSLTNGGPK